MVLFCKKVSGESKVGISFSFEFLRRPQNLVHCCFLLDGWIVLSWIFCRFFVVLLASCFSFVLIGGFLFFKFRWPSIFIFEKDLTVLFTYLELMKFVRERENLWCLLHYFEAFTIGVNDSKPTRVHLYWLSLLLIINAWDYEDELQIVI